MLPGSHTIVEEQKKLEHTKELRREIQEKYEGDYQKAIVEDKEYVCIHQNIIQINQIYYYQNFN